MPGKRRAATCGACADTRPSEKGKNHSGRPIGVAVDLVLVLLLQFRLLFHDEVHQAEELDRWHAAQGQSDKSPLKLDAYWNIYAMDVTEDVSHFDKSTLKLDAYSNIFSILSTPLVSHISIGTPELSPAG